MVHLEMAQYLKEKRIVSKVKKPFSAFGSKDLSPKEKRCLESSARVTHVHRNNEAEREVIENRTDFAFAQLFERFGSPKSRIFYNQRMADKIQDGGLVGQMSSKVESTEGDSDSDDMYAGSRFAHAPAATVLPKPPTSWMVKEIEDDIAPVPSVMTDHLKMLLKVQA